MAVEILKGIKVVDLTSVVFGPLATRILADLGAEVIKVESPGGDQFRLAGKPAKTPLMGPCHLTINRGKRSIVLDLKTGEDQAVMQGLLAEADVFIHNVRGKAIDRLGFGYEAVRRLRPDIVYVHCVGFGSDGPYSDLQAYDDVIQAATGTATLMPRVDGDERPRYLPSLIADKVAGLHGAQAVLAAMIHRLRTGEGQAVEVPMFEAFAHFMLEEHLFGATLEPPTGTFGYSRQLDPARQPFPTADGHISIVPYTDETVIRTFELLGRPDILEDERYATPRARGRNMSRLYEEIALLTPAKTTLEWMGLLGRANIPAMPVRDLNDMLEDPHLKATGFFRHRVHPTEGGFYEMQPPIRYGAGKIAESSFAPCLGQDSATIRAELTMAKNRTTADAGENMG